MYVFLGLQGKSLISSLLFSAAFSLIYDQIITSLNYYFSTLISFKLLIMRYHLSQQRFVLLFIPLVFSRWRTHLLLPNSILIESFGEICSRLPFGSPAASLFFICYTRSETYCGHRVRVCLVFTKVYSSIKTDVFNWHEKAEIYLCLSESKFSGGLQHVQRLHVGVNYHLCTPHSYTPRKMWPNLLCWKIHPLPLFPANTLVQLFALLWTVEGLWVRNMARPAAFDFPASSLKWRGDANYGPFTKLA